MNDTLRSQIRIREILLRIDNGADRAILNQLIFCIADIPDAKWEDDVRSLILSEMPELNLEEK